MAAAPNLAAAESVAHRPLPLVPEGLNDDDVTLLLFYQYAEPPWSKRVHKEAFNTVCELAKTNSVNGRGRCAPEGLNCTLTGPAAGVRAFCEGLRAWSALFHETDFKLTDGVAKAQGFKSLAVRKVDELVNYKLAGAERAPSLARSAGTHLRADEYHAMLEEEDGPETVVVDVRNAYESAIGRFDPPEAASATLVDPQMRNSHDFPRWLAAPETKELLNGKRVMMYCTGGIRCERASALLNELAEATPGFATNGVYELRGGIERYLKTYPDGGHFRGKNYVFDRRMVQRPAAKDDAALAAEVESACAGCLAPCDEYRGKFKCAREPCGVPVILCAACLPRVRAEGAAGEARLLCGLCRDGHEAPTAEPDYDALNRRRAEAAGKPAATAAETPAESKKRQREDKPAANASTPAADATEKKKKKTHDRSANDGADERAGAATTAPSRLFVGKLPLAVNATQLRGALGRAAGGDAAVSAIDWLTDRKTGLFYGSAFVQMASADGAARVVAAAAAAAAAPAASGGVVAIDGKKLRVNLAPLKDGEAWPPPGHTERERPPVC